jgi:hypothetical protein
MLRSSVIIVITVGYVDFPVIWMNNSKSVAARGSDFVYSVYSFCCAFYRLLPESVARIGRTTRPPLDCASACYRKDTRMRCRRSLLSWRTAFCTYMCSCSWKRLSEIFSVVLILKKKKLFSSSFRKRNFRHIFCYKTPWMWRLNDISSVSALFEGRV